MTPLPTITDIFRCALVWTTSHFTRPAVNVIHIGQTGGTPATVWADLDANVTAAMWGQTASDVAISQVNITPLDGSSGTVSFPTGSPSKWTGSGSAGEVTPQVAAIVKFTTLKRGRSYRGRVYLPWVHESLHSYGTFDATKRASMQTAWATFRTAMDTASSPLQVASYVHSTAEPVTACTVETLTATQRLRQPGR